MMSAIACFLVLCLQLLLVGAVPWDGPALTPLAPRVPNAVYPSATPAPVPPNYIFRRDVSPNICGWYFGYIQETYACSGSSTCLWNADPNNKVIACGIPTSPIAFETKCIPYASLASSCDLKCSFNPSINRCPSNLPYCVDITVGGDYIAHACASSQYTTYAPVELTYSGQSSVNTLPRFLLSNGKMSYGTQSPSGGTPSSETPSSSTSTVVSSSPLPTSSGLSTSSPGSQPQTSAQAASPTNTQPASQQSSTAIIAGSVVGGVVGISAIAGTIIWFILRSSRKNKDSLQPAPLGPPMEVKPFGGYYASAPSELPAPAISELPTPSQTSPHMSNSLYVVNSPHMSQSLMLSPASAYHELPALGQGQGYVR